MNSYNTLRPVGRKNASWPHSRHQPSDGRGRHACPCVPETSFTRSKRKAAPAPAPVLELPRPSDGDASDVAGSKLAVRTHVKKDKQLSRPFLISAAAAPPVRMTVPPPAAPPAVMVPSDS